jgi:hypothetical protein
MSHITRPARLVRVLFLILAMLALLMGYAVSRPATMHVHAAASMSAPLDCSGFTDYKRFSVEDQAWWTRMPGQDGTDNGHVHIATCFPLGQKVKGIVPLDFVVTMHENPGLLRSVTIQIGGNGKYVAGRWTPKTPKTPLKCTGTCQFPIHIDMDTRGFANDGPQEVRIRPKVDEPNGSALVGSTSWQVYLANGKPVKGYRDLLDYIQSKGWYDKPATGYAQARMTGGYPYAHVVNGIWTIKVACDASKLKVTGCLVTMDPDIHNGFDGAVQLRTTSAFNGQLQINTRLFSNGWHRLFIRSDVAATSADGTKSTLSGVLGLWVYVNNS